MRPPSDMMLRSSGAAPTVHSISVPWARREAIGRPDLDATASSTLARRFPEGESDHRLAVDVATTEPVAYRRIAAYADPQVRFRRRRSPHHLEVDPHEHVAACPLQDGYWSSSRFIAEESTLARTFASFAGSRVE